MYNKENSSPRRCGALDCMKCGKKLGKSEVFCDTCLEKMAESPVDQNTVVNLPNRPVAPVVKKKTQIRRYLWNIEGENDTLRSKIRWLRFVLIVAVLAFFASLTLNFVFLFQSGQMDPLLNLLPF